jgi:hypothetical protein
LDPESEPIPDPEPVQNPEKIPELELVLDQEPLFSSNYLRIWVLLEPIPDPEPVPNPEAVPEPNLGPLFSATNLRNPVLTKIL